MTPKTPSRLDPGIKETPSRLDSNIKEEMEKLIFLSQFVLNPEDIDTTTTIEKKNWNYENKRFSNQKAFFVCTNCSKRKRKCIVEKNNTSCKRCKKHNLKCLFKK
eukprot:TRINITY_DN3900_c0_g1_i1.p1 TRINITY_DN3900_c0_g1~~TRINITY_DN3900_c0_g1_i1.p1  ORF type:complete len:105 (+),score=27.74 TRINITY_DN3900_c0_g1_i1:255-569(+)